MGPLEGVHATSSAESEFSAAESSYGITPQSHIKVGRSAFVSAMLAISMGGYASTEATGYDMET